MVHYPHPTSLSRNLRFELAKSSTPYRMVKFSVTLFVLASAFAPIAVRGYPILQYVPYDFNGVDSDEWGYGTEAETEQELPPWFGRDGLNKPKGLDKQDDDAVAPTEDETISYMPIKRGKKPQKVQTGYFDYDFSKVNLNLDTGHGYLHDEVYDDSSDEEVYMDDLDVVNVDQDGMIYLSEDGGRSLIPTGMAIHPRYDYAHSDVLYDEVDGSLDDDVVNAKLDEIAMAKLKKADKEDREQNDDVDDDDDVLVLGGDDDDNDDDDYQDDHHGDDDDDHYHHNPYEIRHHEWYSKRHQKYKHVGNHPHGTWDYGSPHEYPLDIFDAGHKGYSHPLDKYHDHGKYNQGMQTLYHTLRTKYNNKYIGHPNGHGHHGGHHWKNIHL